MRPSEPSKELFLQKVRDYHFTIMLSASLRYLVGELEDFDYWEQDFDSDPESKGEADANRAAAEYAIRRVKALQDQIWRCELLVSLLLSLSVKRPIMKALILCREAICQADVPAEAALYDGEPTTAVEICKDAVQRAWEAVGQDLFQAMGSCMTEIQILFPHGCSTASCFEALGHEFASVNMNTMPTLELSEVVRSIQAGIASEELVEDVEDDCGKPASVSRPLLSDSTFRISLSFPGGYREYVEAVATEMECRLGSGTVFYDMWYQAELAQPNLDILLQEIYHRRSSLILVFLSQEYSDKEWCGLEWRAIRDLIKSGRGSGIMLARFDEAPVAGFFSLDGYLDIGSKDPKEVAELVLQRLRVAS